MKRRVVKAVVADVAVELQRSKRYSCREEDPIRRAAFDAWNKAIDLCVDTMEREIRKALRK